MHYIMVALDLAKTFNTVRHDQLLDDIKRAILTHVSKDGSEAT